MSDKQNHAPSFYNQGRPPDPISYLRRLSESEGASRARSDDSADDNHVLTTSDSSVAADRTKVLPAAKRAHRHLSLEEAPAREPPPPPGQAWPHRENMSFTRSLIFYGAGAVTHEHERACKNVEDCRQLVPPRFNRMP
jgi:hypothetical protein